MDTPRKRFKRLATKRANEILYRLKVLGNCSNRSFYDYTEEDINKIFTAIEEQVKHIKVKFKTPQKNIRL